MLPLGTKLLHTDFFVLGNCFRSLLQETLQHETLGGIYYHNIVIGAALPWKERIFRLQLQFTLRAMWEPITVITNVTPLLLQDLSFQNIVCNSFVPNGISKTVDERHHRELARLIPFE